MLRIVWEYRVRPDAREEFERRYGPDGAWAAFFARSSAYRGTVLSRAIDRDGVYLTIDSWRTRQACLEFLTSQAEEYERLDRETRALTLEERCVGHFEDAA